METPYRHPLQVGIVENDEDVSIALTEYLYTLLFTEHTITSELLEQSGISTISVSRV